MVVSRRLENEDSEHDARQPDIQRRTLRSAVSFERPFILDGLREVQPAGDYIVLFEQERGAYRGGTIKSWRHVGTTIRLQRRGAFVDVMVAARDLQTALERDRAQSGNVAFEKRAIARRHTARKLNPFRISGAERSGD